MSNYVVVTVRGVTPTHEEVFPRHDDGEMFPSTFDIRVINDPDVELRNQLDNLIAGRRKGVIGSWDVYNYDPDPSSGWVIDVYDNQCQPLHQIKCVKA